MAAEFLVWRTLSSGVPTQSVEIAEQGSKGAVPNASTWSSRRPDVLFRKVLGVSCVILGLSLATVFGPSNSFEQEVASLEQIAENATVTRDGRSVDGAAGMGLLVGDVATSASASTARILFNSGCYYKFGPEYATISLKPPQSIEIDDEGPCCLESALTEDKNEIVASFGRIEGILTGTGICAVDDCLNGGIGRGGGGGQPQPPISK